MCHGREREREREGEREREKERERNIERERTRERESCKSKVNFEIRKLKKKANENCIKKTVQMHPKTTRKRAIARCHTSQTVKELTII